MKCDKELREALIPVRGPYWISMFGGNACPTFWEAKGLRNKAAWFFRGIAELIDGRAVFVIAIGGPKVVPPRFRFMMIKQGMKAMAEYLNNLHRDEVL